MIDKPANLTVHPAPGETQPTLIGAILHRWPEVSKISDDDQDADPLRPGLVHRLDRDTTGLLMIAKNADSLRSLRDQLRQRTMDKRYLAVVVGAPDPPAGLIDAPIGRDPADPRRMAILDRARPSQTGYETVEQFSDAALLECRLITGRTHQIRVHLSAIGHPIAGDAMYGLPTPLIDRQALHATRLTIRHPVTSEPLTLESDPPADLRSLLSHLREGELLARRPAHAQNAARLCRCVESTLPLRESRSPPPHPAHSLASVRQHRQRPASGRSRVQSEHMRIANRNAARMYQPTASSMSLSGRTRSSRNRPNPNTIVQVRTNPSKSEHHMHQHSAKTTPKLSKTVHPQRAISRKTLGFRATPSATEHFPGPPDPSESTP